MIEPFSLVVPFCDDGDTRISLQMKTWLDYPDWVWDKVSVVLVDDCSKVPLFNHVPIEKLPNCNFDIYRITTDLKWNLPGAFNLGFSEARTDWVWGHDSDHIIPTESICTLIASFDLTKHDTFYQFLKLRRTNNLKRQAIARLASGSWLVHRSMWKQIGGLNENLTGARSGGYGSWDSDFSTRLNLHCNFSDQGKIIPMFEWLPDVLGPSAAERDEITSDANRRNKSLFRHQHIEVGPVLKESMLRFEWEKVYSKNRNVK